MNGQDESGKFYIKSFFCLPTWEIFHDISPFVKLDSVPLKITTTSIFP